MSPEDRDFLAQLRTEKEGLQMALVRLEARMGELEARHVTLPPVPSAVLLPPVPFHLPPVPPEGTAAAFRHPPLPPVPFAAATSAATMVAPASPARTSQPGRWRARLGSAILLLFVVGLAVTFNSAHFVGPWGKFGFCGALSVAVVIWSRRLEIAGRMGSARTMLTVGLAGLYFTFYAATIYGGWHVIPNAFLSGVLLLIWSGLVFYLAARRGSAGLAFVALALAFFGTWLNPWPRFTLAADLLLAGTAVLFFLRRGWSSVLILGLVGTYLALLWRLLFASNGELILDTGQNLTFLPHAVYLAAAWGAFTAAVLLARGWTRGARIAFLTINNFTAAALLLLTTVISGYGGENGGGLLFVSGLVLLGTAVVARSLGTGLGEAYLAQALVVVTLGWLGWAEGLGRDLVLLFATVFLGLAARTSGRRAAEQASIYLAFITTLCLLWAVGWEERDPWLLGLLGGLLMLKLAWWWRARRGTPTLSWPGSFYCALGLALIGACFAAQLSAPALPIVLAVIALALTWIGYAVRWYELPPMAQLLLLAAQALVLFPMENGIAPSLWTAFWVAVVTLLSIFAFRRARQGSRLRWLDVLYALIMVALAAEFLPDTGSPRMVTESLLAVAFLIFGAITRIWSVGALGQIFLLAAVWHYFAEPLPDVWSASIVLAVVFATGRGIHSWLRTYPGFTGRPRRVLRLTAHLYQLLALLMLVRLIIDRGPQAGQPALFLLLGTLILSLNARTSVFGVRASYVLSGVGALLCLSRPAPELATFLTALAALSFLTQPAILRHGLRPLGRPAETWLLVLVSSLTGWVFTAAYVSIHFGPGAVTMGWASFALILFIFGVLFDEGPQSWCGFAILLAAMLRLVTVDFWSRSHGYGVASFFALALVTGILALFYARHAGKVKTSG